MTENKQNWILIDVWVDKASATRAVHVKCTQTGVAFILWQVADKDGQWVDSLLPRIPVSQLRQGAERAKRVIDQVSAQWGVPVRKEPRLDVDPVTGSNIASFLMGGVMALSWVWLWPYL